jgi:hypothetical protein
MRRYLPPGFPRPEHLPLSLGSVRTEIGPCGTARPGDPGVVIGGKYQRGEPGWVRCEGYWVNGAGSSPAASIKVDARDGAAIEAEIGRVWIIPAMLKRSPGGNYVSALPRVLGAYGWTEQAHLKPLLERLRCVCARIFDGHDDGMTEGEHEQELIAVVCQVIGEQYHLTRAELAALGWLTDAEAAAILSAAIAPAIPQPPVEDE